MKIENLTQTEIKNSLVKDKQIIKNGEVILTIINESLNTVEIETEIKEFNMIIINKNKLSKILFIKYKDCDIF